MRNVKFDFIRNSRFTVIISALIILIGVGSIVIKGGLDLGIDFAGGKNIWLKVDSSVPMNSEKLRGFFSTLGAKPGINNIGEEKEQEFFIYYQEKEIKTDKVKSLFNEKIGTSKWKILSEDFVGPKIGKEFKKTAIYAAVLIMIILLIYIGFRFEFKFAIAAIVALLHDVLISIAFVSLLNFKFDTPLLAAILLIIGYSLNDTIVIFDRIREESKDLHLDSRHDYLLVVNQSIVKSLTRTIMTSVTTLMVLVVLILFGGVVLRPMAIILVVGVMAGTYSSNFIASPILVLWEKLFGQHKKDKKAKKKNA